MKIVVSLVATSALLSMTVLSLRAHDVSKNPVTWNREMSRLVFDRCVTEKHL